jgi:uncharacterized protein (DUF58 family)
MVGTLTLPSMKPLDIELLSDLPGLELKARYVMDGFLSGLHRSPYKGFSVEFAQYRAYQPGDDLRRLDWRLYGRTDRLQVREYEAETQMRVIVCVDVSPSMRYGSATKGLTKLDYARMVAASLAMLAQRQRDAVGLAVLGGKLEDFLRPKSSLSNLHTLWSLLERDPGRVAPRLAASLQEAAPLMRRRGIVVILSDFYEDMEPLRAALRRLRHARHDVIALQILDPAEIDFNFEGRGTFVDLETGARIKAGVDEIRESYLERFGNFLKETREMFRDHGADFELLRTDRDPLPALSAYLARREHLL